MKCLRSVYICLKVENVHVGASVVPAGTCSPNAHFLVGKIRMATLQPLVISKRIELEGWEWS